MNFKNCTINFLEKQFGLEQIYALNQLQKWLQMAVHIPEAKRVSIQQLQKGMIYNHLNWNEAEMH